MEEEVKVVMEEEYGEGREQVPRGYIRCKTHATTSSSNGRTDKRTNGQTVERTDGWTNERTDGRTDTTSSKDA